MRLLPLLRAAASNTYVYAPDVAACVPQIASFALAAARTPGQPKSNGHCSASSDKLMVDGLGLRGI